MKKKENPKGNKSQPSEKQTRKRQSMDKKRVKKLINFPFRLLLQVCLIVGLLYFFINYYSNPSSLANLIFNSILIFISLYIAAGIIMLIIFFVISEVKIRERVEQDKLESERIAAGIEKRRMEQDQKLKDKSKKERETRQNMADSTSGGTDNINGEFTDE